MPSKSICGCQAKAEAVQLINRQYNHKLNTDFSVYFMCCVFIHKCTNTERCGKFVSKVKVLCPAVGAVAVHLICVVGTVYWFAEIPLAEDIVINVTHEPLFWLQVPRASRASLSLCRRVFVSDTSRSFRAPAQSQGYWLVLRGRWV